MDLLGIFEALGRKVEVLLSIFCGTKITLEKITLRGPIFRSTPPLCLTHPLILNFFQPSNIQYFEIFIPPFVYSTVTLS